MKAHYDTLETRDPQAREAQLLAALPAHLAHAKANAPGWGRILADVDPATVNARAALAMAPRVAELLARELGRDQSWQMKEVAAFNQVAQSYVAAP